MRDAGKVSRTKMRDFCPGQKCGVTCTGECLAVALRESIACLQFYCHTLPVAYMIDQRKILFWKKVLTSGIQVVRTLAILNKGSIGMILSKYTIPSLTVSVTDIKNLVEALCGCVI